jgi:parallel beta-helix repeat protein
MEKDDFKGKLWIVLALVLFAAFRVCAGQTVSVPHEYPTIQSAIANTVAGGTVYIAPGHYEERLVIDKDLTLRGGGEDPGEVTILGTSIYEPVIQVEGSEASHVGLQNLTITTAIEPIVPRALQNHAVRIRGEAVVTLSEVILFDNVAHGVSIGDNGAVIIEDCAISKNWDGLEAFGSARVELNRCVVSENGVGILLRDAAVASLTDCEFTRNWNEAILVRDSARVGIVGSTISKNDNGVVVEDAGSANIRACRFIANPGFGIFVSSDKADVVGTPCEMTDNGTDLAGTISASLRKPRAPETGRARVEVPGDYDSLQEAVDAVAPGGTVVISDRHLDKGATIWKPLTLEQEDSEEEPTGEPVAEELTLSVLPEGDRVILHGYVIRSRMSYRILMYGTCDFRNLLISDHSKLSIEAGGISSVTIENCSILGDGQLRLTSRGSACVQVTNAQLTELTAEDASQVSLKECRVSETVTAWDTAEVGLEGSTVLKMLLYNQARGSLCHCTLPGGSQDAFSVKESLFGGFPYALSVEDSAVAHVSESDISGASAYDSAQVFLEACTVCFCESNGILASESSQVELVGCTVSGNQTDGVLLERSAFARLAGCTLSDNLHAGVRMMDSAQAEVLDCTIENNGKHGLLLLDSAVLDGKRCSIAKNRWSGAFLAGSARASLDGCSATENWLYGLHMTESALCALISCCVSGNGWHGVGVGAAAQLSTRDCTLSENGGDGLSLFESAGAVVQRSEISHNEGDGVYIEANASLQIEDCSVTSNGECGVRAYCQDCVGTYDPGFAFIGYITGRGNIIPDEQDVDANLEGDVCPISLRLLSTD